MKDIYGAEYESFMKTMERKRQKRLGYRIKQAWKKFWVGEFSDEDPSTRKFEAWSVYIVSIIFFLITDPCWEWAFFAFMCGYCSDDL